MSKKSMDGFLTLIRPLMLIILTAAPLIANSEYHALIDEPVFSGEVHIVQAGIRSNPTVVLVHGLGDDASEVWIKTISSLKENYHVLALDLPGFGASSKNNHLYSPENYVRLLRFLVEKYEIASFHLVGHSMGGAIALRYAATYRDNIKTLTLVDVAGILHRLAYTKHFAPLGIQKIFSNTTSSYDGLISDITGRFLGRIEGREPLDLNLLLNIGVLRQKILQGDPVKIAGLALVLDDFSGLPERVKAPTLIIWGEKDNVAPLRTGHVLNALIPVSVLRVIPGVGHVPIREDYSMFYKYLEEHLSGGISDRTIAQPVDTDVVWKQQETCYGESGRIFSGKIRRLYIQQCRDVIIRNAEIDELVVNNSRVLIENSLIEGKDVGLKAVNSSITVTAGAINGKVAIESRGSRLDIAGSRLTGQVATIDSPVESTFIFSLCHIEREGHADKYIHGLSKLSAGETL